jgi:hypothetical protein
MWKHQFEPGCANARSDRVVRRGDEHVDIRRVVSNAATGNLSDGASRDVTSTATWASSNAGFATVSPSRLVTVVASGELDLLVTMSPVIVVPPPQTFTLKGLCGGGGAAPAAARGCAHSAVCQRSHVHRRTRRLYSRRHSSGARDHRSHQGFLSDLDGRN